jgi:predicted GNAT superfamily acetyltransferase
MSFVIFVFFVAIFWVGTSMRHPRIEAVTIRDLHTIDDYRQVVDLERAIWGYTDLADVVTVPVFIITVKRGAILLGAFDAAARMIGFAYSLVGMKDGRPIQWSHMLGVLSDCRNSGLGRRLKLMQRERAMAAGFDLIEWTFDPMQAMNAHLNFAKLGVVAEEYEEDVYGESTSTLHRGTPTDRFIVQWRIREPHVEHRIAGDRALVVRSAEVAEAPPANTIVADGGWSRCSFARLDHESSRVWVEIPMGVTEMQQQAPDLALDWRFQTREIFEGYFGRGYRAVDFVLDRETRRGRYLLARRA